MADFVDIFAGMSWVSVVLLLLGFVLLFLECLTPGVGVAGITGLVCIVAGVVVRALSATLSQILLLILFVLVLIGVIFAIFVHSAKKGFLSKTGIVESGTVLKPGYGEIKHKELLNQNGITRTVCRPSGKVEINGEIFDAMTNGNYIEANREVRVVKVEFDYLYICEINNKIKRVPVMTESGNGVDK